MLLSLLLLPMIITLTIVYSSLKGSDRARHYNMFDHVIERIRPCMTLFYVRSGQYNMLLNNYPLNHSPVRSM